MSPAEDLLSKGSLAHRHGPKLQGLAVASFSLTRLGRCDIFLESYPECTEHFPLFIKTLSWKVLPVKAAHFNILQSASAVQKFPKW